MPQFKDVPPGGIFLCDGRPWRKTQAGDRARPLQPRLTAQEFAPDQEVELPAVELPAVDLPEVDLESARAPLPAPGVLPSVDSLEYFLHLHGDHLQAWEEAPRDDSEVMSRASPYMVGARYYVRGVECVRVLARNVHRELAFKLVEWLKTIRRPRA